MKHATEWLAVIALVAVLVAAVIGQDPPRTHTANTAASSAGDDGAPFVIRHVRVFDGENVFEDRAVVVRDGRIESVGQTPEPAGLRVVDGQGKTLLPGLIDAHAHSWGDAQRDALRFGVTVELDMHGDWHRLPALKLQRESLARVGQADLWAAGVALTVAGGHGTQYGLAIPTINQETDIPAFVAARVGEGSDFIKLIIEDMGAYGSAQPLPTLDARQVGEAINAAHTTQRLAIVHVSGQHDAMQALAAGVDGMAHVFIDEPASAQFVAAAKAREIFVVPTLSVMAAGSDAGDGRSLAEDARVRPFLTPAQAQSLAARFEAIAGNPRLRENALTSVSALHAAGVAILAGTDAGNPGTTHGASLHGELELLVRAGLTPRQALAAATSLPAQRFGLADRGRIAPGMRADLLLVEGNPLNDITNTRAIAMVWKNGFPVERTPPAIDSVAAAIAPTATRISDFEGAAIDVASGGSWGDSSDAMMGGGSNSSYRLVEGGAEGSRGALEVSGEIKPGFAFPWAGVTLFVGTTPMQPVDYSARRELVFHARGDGREIRVMLFSGPSTQAMPSMRSFIAGAGWSEHHMPLAEFNGADATLLRAIAFSAGEPAGAFRFRIDRVELR